MFQNPKQMWLWAVAISIFAFHLVWDASPAKGGKKAPPPYTLTDLMGLSGYSLQSQGKCLTDRGADGSVLIVGNSYEYTDPDSPAPRLPG